MNGEPILKETVTLDNSELKKIADRVVNTIILAATKVSVEKEFKPIQGTFEHILQERLHSFDETKQNNIKTQITPFYNAPKETRIALYGELGKIDLKSTRSIEQAVIALPPVTINPGIIGIWTPPPGVKLSSEEIAKERDKQTEIYSTHNRLSIDAITGGGQVFSDSGLSPDDSEVFNEDFEPQAVTDKLGVYIRRIKCVDETNPESVGSDEIAIGGTSVDETGDTKKISERYVGGGFDDGDTKWYNYPIGEKFHWFSLREEDFWPKSYFLTFVLAEKDMGGLIDFLQKLWDKVKDYLLETIATAVGGIIGSVFGPGLGTLIGAALGYIVGKVVEWFINCWKDDIFPPKTVSCTVPSYHACWRYNSGDLWMPPIESKSSPCRRSHFYGHGGHYYIEYYWKLYA